MKVSVYHLTVSRYLMEYLRHSPDVLDRPEVKENINRYYDAMSFGSNVTRRKIWEDNDNDLRYRKIATVTVDSAELGEIGMLEKVFELTNHIDQDWTLNPEVKMETVAACRSSSVGDIFVLDDVPYVVDSCGFCPLSE